ncbi:MAG: cytochrome c3 family protein, partial [Pyrinomonadaceae bacterium]
HQDVIAAVRPTGGVESAHAAQTGNAQKYNNCTICHAAETKQIVTATNVEFLPPVGTFKTAPTGHSSCFTCHYQKQTPTAIQCAGCHTLAPKDLARVAVPDRLSLKFTHDREQHVAECTTCHINITRESSVRGLKPDVPITSCASCHKTSTDKKIITLEIEFEARSQDAKFTCVKCHTTGIGGRELPPSHRAVMAQ